MNMPGKNRLCSASARLVLRCAGLIVGTVFLSLAAPAALGDSTVITLGGGRVTATGPDAGFTDGDILQTAQFNLPSGCAVDASGRIYVADRNNGALRRLELAANRCRTLLSNLRQPVAVVVNAANVVFVLTEGDGRIQKLDRSVASVVSAGLTSPTAMALSGSNSVYVTQSNGVLVKVNTSNGAISAPLISGLKQPSGVVALDSGLVAVSETAGNMIRIFDPLTGALKLQVGSGLSGFANGPKETAQFNRPFQMAKAPGGNIIVADRSNHRVRLIALDGFVTTLYGVDPATWEGPACTTCNPVILPGWLDGDGEFAEAREPIGVAVSADGNVYTTEAFYHLVRQVSGLDLSGGDGGGDGGDGGNTNSVALPPVITPASGYYPMGQIISVFNPNVSSLLSTAVYYTTDGTEPTTNSFRVMGDGSSGTIFWQEKQRDLSSLQLKAFLGSNPSPVVSGQPVLASEIGVSQDIAAGIGSRVIVPVVVNLRTNDQFQSLQFRVEVTPGSPATPMIPATFAALSISTNDLIPVATGGEGTDPALFQVMPYSTGNNRGLVVTFIGTNSNLSLKHFGVAAMLALPIPPSAKLGDRYTIEILNPSGTADAAQQRVAISPMPRRSVVVTEARYGVGDAAPATWYNAVQLEPAGTLRPGFGDDILDNSDVNLAFAAAMGSRLPYPQTDLFDALDAYPEDTSMAAGGDGLIRYLDWQVILMRSLGLDLARWERTWSDGGVRVTTGPANRGSADALGVILDAAPPGAVWTRQAALSAPSAEHIVPGTAFDVPVYVQVSPGYELAGLAFRVRVEPDGAAPLLDRAIRFVPNPNMPPPTQSLAPSPDTVLCGWPLAPSGSFNPPLQGRTLLGYVRITLPGSAQAGQVYTMRFTNADGSPDLQTQYDFETQPASLWVLASASRPADLTSDEWKIHFFGSLTAELARPDADPDHDGVPNWAEYAAGTNPTDAHSQLRLQVAAGTQMAAGVVLSWLSAPGKSYQIETAPTLSSADWTVLTANLPGDGRWQQWTHHTLTSKTCFYRIRVQP